MSYVIAAPEPMTSAASDLAAIGSNVHAAHMVAAAGTTSVIPAAADEVSAGIAQLFSQHAANYQALAGQAAAFNDQFVHNLTAGAFSYTSIEAAITASLNNFEPAITAFLNNAVADIAGLVGNLGGFLNFFLTANFNIQVSLVVALLEIPFLIPFLLLTSPIWLPLLIVFGPILATLAIA